MTAPENDISLVVENGGFGLGPHQQKTKDASFAVGQVEDAHSVNATRADGAHVLQHLPSRHIVELVEQRGPGAKAGSFRCVVFTILGGIMWEVYVCET